MLSPRSRCSTCASADAAAASALTNHLMAARLAEAAAAGTPLLSLVPRLERRVGFFDTAAMPYLVGARRRATEAALPAIHALLARSPGARAPGAVRLHGCNTGLARAG